MLRTIVGLIALAAVTAASAQSVHLRSGYVTKDGTYVAPSYATNPNSTRLDNFSTKGNVNPYTGTAGRVEFDAAPAYRAPSLSTYQAPTYLSPYLTLPGSQPK